MKREWIKLGRKGHKASDAIFHALKDGILVRAAQCEMCGDEDRRVVAHHEDYSHPLMVSWLCDSCHKQVHLLPEEGFHNEWEMPLANEAWKQNSESQPYTLGWDADDGYSTLARERAKLLHKAVQTLKPRHQILVKLRYFEGLRFVDVGRAVGISRCSAINALKRVRTILADKLTQME